jgi:hypothetical protein
MYDGQQLTTYFGLKIVDLPGVLRPTIHDNDYLYVGRPTGTSYSPYRIQDFCFDSNKGYDINAVPNIYGDMFREKPAGSELPIFARVSYKGNNPTGINLFAMTGNGYAGDTSSFVPNAFYVGVMKSLIVNGTIQSSSWRVLYRSNDPNITEVPSGETPSPLDDSSSPLDPSYEGHLDSFSHYFYTDVPANSTGDYKITFFIISVANINTYYPGAKSGWLTYDSESVHRTNPIPIPGLIGRNLTIGSHDHGYDVALSKIEADKNQRNVTAFGSTSIDGREGGTYTPILKFKDSTTTFTVTGNISDWRNIGVSNTFNLTWDLSEYYVGVIPSGTYEYTITIYYGRSGNSFTVCTETGELNVV